MLNDPLAPIARTIIATICENIGRKIHLRHAGQYAVYTLFHGDNYTAHVRASDKTQNVSILSVVLGKSALESLSSHNTIPYSHPDLFQVAAKNIEEIMKAPRGHYEILRSSPEPNS